MFFIMGLSQGERKLNFDQLIICKSCGKYGHMDVVMIYSYLTLFFIPIFKWNKRYYVRMNCCGASCEINSEIGKGIEKGRITSLNEDALNFEVRYEYHGFDRKHCAECGFTTNEDYVFCPKCGTRL